MDKSAHRGDCKIMARILITGATGLIGTHLHRVLSERHEVIPMSRKLGYDLRDKDKVREVIETFKPEIIYHLAANAAESRGQISPIDMTERNMNIFLNVLVPAINSGVKRFIYTSSVAVYGEAEVPYSEDDICKPKDVYGVNKLACEQILKILAKVHGFEYTIFRPHNLYGPRQDMSNPYKNVVALFMRNIMEDKEIILFGEGKMRRAFSYVDDVVEVLIAAMEEKFKGQTINVGSCIDYEIGDVLKMIEKIAGKKANIKYMPARAQEIWNFIPSHRRQNALCNYKETPIEVGLQTTWESINLPQIIHEDNEITTY